MGEGYSVVASKGLGELIRGGQLANTGGREISPRIQSPCDYSDCEPEGIIFPDDLHRKDSSDCPLTVRTRDASR